MFFCRGRPENALLSLQMGNREQTWALGWRVYQWGLWDYRRRARLAVLLGFPLAFSSSTAWGQAQASAPLRSEDIVIDDFVNDVAGVLSPHERRDLERVIGRHMAQAGAELAVLTVLATVEPLENFSLQVARRWSARLAPKRERVLLTLVIRDHRSRLEVSSALSTKLTDERCQRILDDMTPLLRAHRYEAALSGAELAIFDALAPQARLLAKTSDAVRELGPWGRVQAAWLFLGALLSGIIAEQLRRWRALRVLRRQPSMDLLIENDWDEQKVIHRPSTDWPFAIALWGVVPLGAFAAGGALGAWPLLVVYVAGIGARRICQWHRFGILAVFASGAVVAAHFDDRSGVLMSYLGASAIFCLASALGTLLFKGVSWMGNGGASEPTQGLSDTALVAGQHISGSTSSSGGSSGSTGSSFNGGGASSGW